jgi:uncharacterized protein (DUF58 family)
MPPTPPGVYANLADLVRLRHRARGFSLLPRQPVRSLLAGRHASRLSGRGLNFEEIRRYLPGDDVRQIDWKVTARTRVPHARVFTEERERPVVLVVDQRPGMFFGTVRAMKSVAAVEAAALAAWRAVAAQDRVGLVAFGDAAVRVVRPRRSPATVLQILHTLLELNHALRTDTPARPDGGTLNEAVRRAAGLVPHDGLVVLVTDGDGADADTRRLLTEAARHNDVLVLFVFDPVEADLPDVGRAVLSDGGRQLEVATGGGPLRAGFRDEFARRRAEAKRFLLARETPVLPLRTDEPAADQIARALGARPRAAGR